MISKEHELTFILDLQDSRSQHASVWSEQHVEKGNESIPRIARLMALAIRLDGLIREKALRDYADIARRGRITRARMTQIMRLLDLAPDIQERLLFLTAATGLNERKLRPVAAETEWTKQRRLFCAMAASLQGGRKHAPLTPKTGKY